MVDWNRRRIGRSVLALIATLVFLVIWFFPRPSEKSTNWWRHISPQHIFFGLAIAFGLATIGLLIARACSRRRENKR